MTTTILKDVNVVLLDIEGTTTSISFVKDILFPYARSHLESFLKEHWNDPDIFDIINQIKFQHDDDVARGIPDVPPVQVDDIPSVVQNLLWQMDNDRKTTGLKGLQGKIWKSGYETREITSHLFPDVKDALDCWAKSKKIYIYSSGSVAAQKLLFGHTEFGDLSEYLSGYFDTTTGSKVECESYSKIASSINEAPDKIVFFTDSLQEADAALEAGIKVVLMTRPGNPVVSIPSNKYFLITDTFENIQ